MISGELIRTTRLLQDGNVVVVATDHGGMNGPVPGLEGYSRDAQVLRAADAILLFPGMISRLLQPTVAGNGELTIQGRMPKLIVRLNWMTNFYFKAGYREGINREIVSIADATMLGADAVMASFQVRTGSETTDADNMALFAGFVAQKRELGIPLFAEIYPSDDVLEDERLLHEHVKDSCRMSAELGADMIKTFYTGARFSEVVASTPIPIFVLGASKCPEEEALQKASDAVNAGARGVVYGRNVFQSKDPARFLEALRRVVKQGSDPTETAREMELL